VVSPCPDRDGYRSPQRASVIFIKMMRIYLFERLFHKQASRNFPSPVGREKECLSALKSVVANVGPRVRFTPLRDAAAVFGEIAFGWFGARQQTAQIAN